MKKKKIKNSNDKYIQIIYKTILLHCLKCSKNTESKNHRVAKIKNERIILSSNCALCGSAKIEIYQRTRSKRTAAYDW